MNSITIGQVQSSPVSTTTDNQCAFSDTFTTLRAKGLSQHPTGTTTSVISIDNEGVIAVGGSAGTVSTLLSGAGQLITLNGTTEVALDPGTNGQVLTANSSAADGIEWANLPTTQAGSASYGVIIGTTPQNGTGTISIGYGAGAYQSDATNCIIVGPNSNCGSGASNTIILGSGTTTSVSNEFNLPQIDHLNIPSLTTDSVRTGTLLQFGSSQTGWVQAAGGTNNTVAKIDSAISSLQSSVATNTSDIATLQSTSGTHGFLYNISSQEQVTPVSKILTYTSWTSPIFANSSNLSSGIWTCLSSGL